MKAIPVVSVVCLVVALAGGVPAFAEVGGKSAARGKQLSPAKPQSLATLQSLDGGLPPVQFRPTEIRFKKSVPWNKHKSSRGETSVLEFTNAEPMTLGFEMLFDEYPSKKNVYDAYIGKLEALASVATGDEKRPPLCVFTWGSEFPSFKGVIESLSVKYTMFLPDGTPVRAEVSLEMKQASKLVTRERVRKSLSGSASSAQKLGLRDAPAGD